MEGKKWLILLGIVNALAMAGIIFWYVNRDNIPPVITREGEFIFEESMSDSELLQGVAAVDETDGDVSHTLVVEKVTVNQKSATATITCGAMDNSGNIAKQSFRVEAKIIQPDPIEKPTAENSGGAVFTLEAGEAEIGAGITDEEGAGEETEGQNIEEQLPEDDAEDEIADEPEEDAENEDAGEAENAAPANAEPAPAPEETPQVAQHEIPELYFNSTEVVTNRGYNPAWVTVIEYMHDNRDSYEDLLGNIKIVGNFTNAELGTYDVMVSVVDSDGNESAAKPMRIVVVE